MDGLPVYGENAGVLHRNQATPTLRSLHAPALDRPRRVRPPGRALMSYREGRFWQPDVTVATLVVREGRLLCVEERSNGHVVINQPAGHLEPNESLLEAAVRETREESGWNVRVTHMVGCYQWKSPSRPDGGEGRHYLRFAFAAEALGEIPDARLDEGIVRALWLAPSELQAMESRHRSPLVWRCVSDFLAGCRHPLSLVQQLA